MIVGLTGSFGTGKSFVASIFKRLGAKVIDADDIAREALEKGSSPYKRIVAAFGDSVLDKSRNIDRRKLSRLVFGSPARLKTLNRIVHPPVISEIISRAWAAGGRPVIVIDAPLLVEANLAGMADLLVVVKAPRSKQIERCMRKFKELKKEDVLKRIRSQVPIEKKVKMADFVIDNGQTKSRTAKQVMEIWRKVKLWR